MTSPVLRPALLLVLFGASACSIDIEGRSAARGYGSGLAGSERRELAAFHAIEARGAFHLEVEVGGPPEVELRADEDLLHCIQTEVRGGVLRIRDACRRKSRTKIHLRVSVPELAELHLHGSQWVEVDGVTGPRLLMECSGSVVARVEGEVEELDLATSGASRLELGGLATRRSRLRLSGSSRVELAVEEELRLRLSGSSTIRYRGRPALEVDQSGTASIRRLE